MGTAHLTSDAKDVVIAASACGLTSLLGATIFFFFWNWVGYFDTEQSLFMIIIAGAAFALIGGMMAGVTGMKIRITNEKLCRGICGAIAGMFSMIAVEQFLPTFLFNPGTPRIPFVAFGLVSAQLFALIMGTIAGASAGFFSALYIGTPGFAEPGILSAAEGCALAIFTWVLVLGLTHHDPGANFFTAILFSSILALIGGVIAGILGGLLGWLGNQIGYAGNRTLSRLVGVTCGAALGMMIMMIVAAGMFAQ